MGQTPSIPSEYARLILSNNSLRNNTLDCDALGIHYQLTTPTKGIKLDRITTFSRWEPQTQDIIEIADYERKSFRKDRIRIRSGLVPGRGGSSATGEDGEDGFVPLDRFLERTKGFPGSVRVDRTFKANGKEYTWKSRDGSLTLYGKQDGELPIASFSGRKYLVDPHMPYIKLAPGCEEILDYIVVSCIIAEKKRRDAKKAQNSAAGGGGGGGSC